MLPPSLAFAWVVWRRHGRGLYLMLGYLLIAAALSAVLPPYCAPGTVPFALGFVALIVLSATAFFLVGIFTGGFESADIMARESCFPARLFRLPVRTESLVLWPMVGGAAAVILLWLFVALFLLRPWLDFMDDKVPLWWPALFLAASLGWVQALAWSPFGLRGLRAFLFFVFFAILATAYAFGVEAKIPEGWLVGAYASLTLAAWMVGYIGVRYGRRGDAPDWEVILTPFYWIVRWWYRRRGPFVSAARAQVWYEWRLNGWSIPFFTLLLLTVSLMPLLLGENDVLPTEQTLLSSLVIPIFLASIFGANGGGNDGAKGRVGLGSFSATLPLGTTDMVAAMLKVSARSSLAAWAVMAVALPLAVLLTGKTGVVARHWRDAMANHQPVQVIAGIVALVVVLIVATWRRQVDRLYFGLTGRAWVANSIALVLFPCWVGLCFLAGWLYQHLETHTTVLAILPWLLGPIVLIRFAASMWALRAVLDRGLLKPQTAAWWAAAWLVVASTLVVVLAWAVPTDRVPVYYLAFGVLFAMPMARLTAAPLALAWNRHR
jgi:hypothetical protein